jgi:hypothetical protein
MIAEGNRIGRVGYRQAIWDEVRGEIGDDERFPSGASYVLLERPEHIKFVTKMEATANDLFAQHWTSGHLFNETGELNFEKQGHIYDMRLLTESDLPDGWIQSDFEADDETSLLLFGERKRDSDPGWREARIPQWLKYPVAKTKGRVLLIAVPYLREGMVVRMRLKKVEVQ